MIRTVFAMAVAALIFTAVSGAAQADTATPTHAYRPTHHTYRSTHHQRPTYTYRPTHRPTHAYRPTRRPTHTPT
jgi:hypothetical protein